MNAPAADARAVLLASETDKIRTNPRLPHEGRILNVVDPEALSIDALDALLDRHGMFALPMSNRTSTTAFLTRLCDARTEEFI